MQLLRFLIKSAPRILILTSLASFISGTLTTGLIVIVHRAVTKAGGVSGLFIGAFVALVLGRLLSSYLSEIALMRYAQKSIAELRTAMIRKLLFVPYRHFEMVGRAKIYAALTADIETINYTLIGLAGFAINFAVLVGAGIYLTVLSWKAMAILAVMVVIGIALHRVTSNRANRFFEMARDQNDKLYGHFRAITEGTKELKLHRPRRLAFVEKEVVETTQKLVDYTMTAQSRYFVGRVTSNLFFFAVLGLVIFIMPTIQSSASTIVSGCF
jgi:putative pyoverdin transport system ATP-binding/permease protein